MTDTGDEPDDFGRREILRLAGILGGLSLLPATARTAFAATQDNADFLAVSKALVGREDLSLPFNDALLAAFRKNDASFDAKLAQLRKMIGDAPVSGEALKAALTGAGADIAALPQSILTGWYLGIAGSGSKAICVAYTDALANRLVADVVRPQSYSYGAYGSWAIKPA